MAQLRQHQVVLRGARVLLRPLIEEDWDALLKWNRDPDVLYFVEADEVSQLSLEEVQRIYRSVCRDAFCFIIEVLGQTSLARQPVGECWLQRMNLERVLSRYPGRDCRRIDLMIGERAFWGHGLGTEVIRLLAAFGFVRQSLDRCLPPTDEEEKVTSVAFGRTGLTVSRLCFGTPDLGPMGDGLTPEAGGDLLAHAFELGVTFWDTSDNYGTHPHIAAALRQVPREQVVIATKTYEPEGAIQRALRELGTDYLDIMLIHCVGLSWIEQARKALEVLAQDKARGLVRAVGFSTHSAEVTRQAAEWPEVEVLLAIVNPTGTWDPNDHIEDGTIADVLRALERAHAAGKGVYAMKVLGCGALASDPAQAIGFAARLPYVHSLCIGMRSLDEVRRNLALLNRAENVTGVNGGLLRGAGPPVLAFKAGESDEI